MNAGRAVERVDRKPGIVGKGGKPGRLGRGFRLDARVVAKRHSRFVRFRKLKLACRYGVDSIGRKQIAHFSKLAGVMRRDHETPGYAAMRRATHITAIFCRSISLAMPLRASAKSAENCASENGSFSAVACTSTIFPEPVRTKLASVSACESSA